VGARKLERELKVKLLLSLIKHHALWQVDVWLHVLLALTLDVKPFASRPDRFNSEESASGTP